MVIPKYGFELACKISTEGVAHVSRLDHSASAEDDCIGFYIVIFFCFFGGDHKAFTSKVAVSEKRSL